MATTQIPLLAYFNALNPEQQKEYIEQLQKKIEFSHNVDYVNFLNDCINSYNTKVTGDSVHGLASIQSAVVGFDNISPTAFQQGSFPANFIPVEPKKCTLCGNTVVPSHKKCPYCFVAYSHLKQVDSSSLILALIGLAFTAPPLSLFSMALASVMFDSAVLFILVFALILSIRKKTTHKTTAAFIISIVGLGLLVMGFLVNLILVI